MSILTITPLTVGAVDVNPRGWSILTNDTYATVIVAGYLTQYNTDLVEFKSSDYAQVYTTDLGTIELAINVNSAGVVSFIYNNDQGSITYPVTLNHIAVFSATSSTASTLTDDPSIAINGGSLQAGLSGTAGYVASFPATAAKGSLRLTAVANTGDTLTTISNAAMGQASVVSIPDPGAATANFILSSKSGGQSITLGGLTVSGGSIVAGVSGTAGTLTSFPATASKGSLIVAAVANTGDTLVTLSNAAHGQASVYSIPDVGAATGQLNVVTGALVSGNLMKASGTAGKLADAGFFIKAAVTAAYGGGGTSNAFTATGITTASIVTASIVTSSNAVSITKVVPTADVLTVNFSADPGSATTVSWIATSAAVA